MRPPRHLQAELHEREQQDLEIAQLQREVAQLRALLSARPRLPSTAAGVAQTDPPPVAPVRQGLADDERRDLEARIETLSKQRVRARLPRRLMRRRRRRLASRWGSRRRSGT